MISRAWCCAVQWAAILSSSLLIRRSCVAQDLCSRLVLQVPGTGRLQSRSCLSLADYPDILAVRPIRLFSGWDNEVWIVGRQFSVPAILGVQKVHKVTFPIKQIIKESSNFLHLKEWSWLEVEIFQIFMDSNFWDMWRTSLVLAARPYKYKDLLLRIWCE